MWNVKRENLSKKALLHIIVEHPVNCSLVRYAASIGFFLTSLLFHLIIKTKLDFAKCGLGAWAFT